MNYLYIIREREFKSTNVYKIGRTTQQLHERIKAYPKDSELIISMQVENCVKMENTLKKLFKKQFIHRSDIGAEYFEGDVNLMKSIFKNIEISDISETRNVESGKTIKPTNRKLLILGLVQIFLIIAVIVIMIIHLIIKK